MHEEIVGLDSAIFMHPKTWKASGHVDAFNDPLVDNKDSKKRYRADQLIEGEVEKLLNKAEKEVDKARKRFGESFEEELFRDTNPRVKDYTEKARAIEEMLAECLTNNDMGGLKALIDKLEIADPESGSRNWTDVRQFNLMFSTQMSNIASEDEARLYLRPETAQGIFVNFLNVQKTTRQKIPFGIAQIGKAFRNEIVARQFIFRMREFEQMEMQYFVRPGAEMEFYDFWKVKRMAWHKAVNPDHKLRFKDHEALAHYANAAVDIEFEFPFGFRELEGVHSRTDFDLGAHQTVSGKKIQYFDPELNESYVPYVVETSVGCDRMFLAVLSSALKEETVPDAEGKESTRTVLRIAPALAPVKCAVLPLLKNKEELVGKAREVFDQIKFEFPCQYDEKDAIGRRYRRQDAIGTPYCITIDFDTLEDNTVTLRERDSMVQERVPLDKVASIVNDRTNMNELLKSL
jgi:glycyl-tRNA synthetase